MNEDEYIESVAAEPVSAFYNENFTYADYLNFTFEEMVEIIRGKVFRMSPAPASSHQMVSRNLFGKLFIFLQGSSCQLFSAPFDVILPVKGKDFMQSDKVVQPDICVICDPTKIKEKGCFGAPDWIIEILSPQTTKKDLQIKYEVYEESGVSEYWIVDPRTKIVEVFFIVNGKYQRMGAYVDFDLVRCNLFRNLEVDLTEIFEGLELIN